MPRPKSVATLALSLICLFMSLGAAIYGARNDDLFAEPGRAESAAP